MHSERIESNRKMKNKAKVCHTAAWLTGYVMASFFIGIPAQAASFDCAKAATKIEKLICGDDELSRLDEELNAAYKKALKDEKQADSTKQAQKQWIKVRNGCSNVTCVKRAYETRLTSINANTLASEGIAEQHEDIQPDKPGFFRLNKSTNDKVCSTLNQIINGDITKFGKTRFDTHTEFVKWRNVEESQIDRGAGNIYDGILERANVDINNDGVVDQVIKSQWSVRGVLDDSLNILPLSEKELEVAKLVNSDKKVNFNAGNYWIDRYKKKYGNLNFDWVLDGVASINLLRLNNETYVVAQNYAAPRDVPANIYAFQLDKAYRKYEEKDVCMFVRICPCGGCKYSGGETDKMLPAKKWCITN